MNEVIESLDFFIDFEADSLINNLSRLQNYMVTVAKFKESDSLSYGYWNLNDEGFPEFIEAIILKMKVQLKLQSEYNHVQIVDTLGIQRTNRLYPAEFTNELSNFSNEAIIIQIGCNGLLNHDRIVYANSALLLSYKHFVYSPEIGISDHDNAKRGYTLIFHKLEKNSK
jgi:hypothetical protein